MDHRWVPSPWSPWYCVSGHVCNWCPAICCHLHHSASRGHLIMFFWSYDLKCFEDILILISFLHAVNMNNMSGIHHLRSAGGSYGLCALMDQLKPSPQSVNGNILLKQTAVSSTDLWIFFLFTGFICRNEGEVRVLSSHLRVDAVLAHQVGLTIFTSLFKWAWG